MDIFQFSDAQPDADKEYKFKVLVYPNITYQRDLEKDSYVVVLSNVIKVLNSIRDDIHFTIISPNNIESLNLPNCKQIYLPMPSYPNSMRCHFNFDAVKKLIDWKHNDFDILYSHLPEHTSQLMNLFYNATNIQPKCIGYCHWYELPENTEYAKNVLMHNIAGTLEMEECGVNSNWLKNFILSHSADIYSPEILEKLQQVIQPHLLGVDNVFKSYRIFEPKSILFNHRPNNYTGFSWFVKSMNELWKKRQDFKVYTTLTDIDEPWAERLKISSRSEYLETIRKMYFGVGCFEKYSAWSISTTDGLSNGVPYLLPNKLCYPEMIGPDYPLLYNGRAEFIEYIEKLFDTEHLYTKASQYISDNIDSFLWNNRVTKWFKNWNCFDENTFQTIGDKSTSYHRIVDFIKKNKNVTKKQILDHLGWGVRISFSPYRNRLRLEKDIELTLTGYKYIG